MAGKTAKSSSSTFPDPKRRFVVFSVLAASLTVTGVFLHLLSPPPVRAQVQGTVLMGEPIERVSLRNEPAKRSWKYIYVHQSKSSTAATQAANGDLTDHFVICNGAGSGVGDGDLLIGPRWKQQRPAIPPAGASTIDADCISIGLVGDLDRSRPTQAQMRRLAELVASLRAEHRIPGGNIWAISHPTQAGVGRMFPVADFRRQLLP